MSVSYSLPVAAAYTDAAGTITLVCASTTITFIQVVASASECLFGSMAGNTASIGALPRMYAALEKRYPAIRHANVEIDDSSRVTLFDFSA